MELHRHSLANRSDEFKVNRAGNDTWCRDSCGCIVGKGTRTVASSGVSQNCSPWINHQRVPIALSFGIVLSKLSRSNDVALCFDSTGCMVYGTYIKTSEK
jgi:hypothetical protein